MSITATERTQIVELTALMFNAAPGATYLSQIVALYEANGHNLSALANSLTGTGAFALVYPNSLTDSDFASQFLATVGLQNDQFAKDWITSKLASGMSKGQVVYAAFNALNNVSSTDGAQYQAAKAILLNKTAVAEFYSEAAPLGIGGAATDLGVLKGVIAPVTADPGSVTTTEAALSAAQTFVLTTGADVATAGNFLGSLNLFAADGVGPTLTTGDLLTGADRTATANNTLNLNDQYGNGTDILPTGIQLNNIQTVALTTSGNAGQLSVLTGGASSGGVFDTSAFPSVTNTTVTSFGGGTDAVQASSTSNISVTHKNVGAGGVNTFGGNNVTVATNGSGGVNVGGAFGGAGTNQVLPAGNISVTANGLGNGAANVNVAGGQNVTVNVNSPNATGNITIGNVAGNQGATGDATTGTAPLNYNPTGNINVTSQSTVGSGNVDTIFGGANVTVNVKGDQVYVGDSAATTATNQPSGAVVVNNLQPVTYDGLTGAGHNNVMGGEVEVYGGTNVTVNSNTGNYTYIGNTDNGAGMAGTMPSGDVTVTQTGADRSGAYGIGDGLDAWNTSNWTEVTGGANVSVTTAGGDVYVGSFNGTKTLGDPTGTVTVTETVDSHAGIQLEGGTSVNVAAKGQQVWVGDVNAPSGAVTVNQSSVYTGYAAGASYNASSGSTKAASVNGNSDTSVNVFGGTSVTVNTTGGNVQVGGLSPNGKTYYPTGAVNITNTFSGANTANASTVTVQGGTTVNITETNGTSGAISVGAAPVINTAGTGVKNTSADPTGNVTIVNGSLAGKFGTSATTVYTNGATQVSVTGAGATTIADVNSFAQTIGVNAGSAVGTSTLATVILDGVQGAAAIDSNAIANLTIADSVKTNAATAATIGAQAGFSAVPAHALNLTLSNDSNGATSLTDATATSITVGTSGAGADVINLVLAKATTATFNNAAALTATMSAAVDPKMATITANNSGSLNLGDLSDMGAAKLTAINAATATGAITVTIDPTKTAFNGTGSTGAETVGITSNTITLGVHGGTNAGNILDANYAASAADTPLGNNAKVSGFSTLEVAGANAGTVAHGVNHTYQGPVPAVPAVQQVDTVSIGGTPVAGDVFSETVTVNGGASHVYSYTATATDTPATVAANLAAAIVAGGNSGVQVQYTSGNTFTLTAPVASTTFTATSAANTGAGTGANPAIATTVPATAAVAQVDQFTFTGGPATGADNIAVIVNGTSYSTPVFAGETVDQLATALAAVVNNDATAAVTASTTAGGLLNLTAKVAGTSFTDSVVDTGIVGIGAGGPNTLTANASAGYETVTETFGGVYSAGNVITEQVNGVTVSYTVTAADVLDPTNAVLAGHIAAALTGVGATVSAAGNVVTITDADGTPGDSMNVSATVANAASPATEATVVTTTGNAGSPAIPGDGVYDATNFTALMVGATNAATPDVIFTNVASGTPLTFVANQAAGGVTDYILKDASGANDTLPLTVGVDGSTTGLNVTVQTTGVENIALNSVGKSGTNIVTISDPAASTLTIAGDSATNVTMWDAGIKSIDASHSSGDVDVTNVILSTEWVGGTHTITGGTGALTAHGGTNVNDVDTITTGTGGGTITIGQGGAWGTQDVLGNFGYSAGSETINLGTPAGTATNTLVVNDGVIATNNGTAGGVNNFVTDQTSQDMLTFAVSKTAIGNQTAATVVNTLWDAPAAAFDLAPFPLGNLFQVLGNLAYTSSNGVITFSAVGTHTMSEFSTAELISAAEIIVNSYGGDSVAMFSTGGNTYVVSNDSNGFFGDGSILDGNATNLDSVVELIGKTGLTGFGATAAATTVMATDVTNVTPEATTGALVNSGAADVAVFNAAGFSLLDAGSFAGGLGTTSTTINGLAPSSELNLAGGDFNAVTVNQPANSSLTVDLNAAAGAHNALTLNGDWEAVVNSAGTSVLQSLTDGGAAATLTTLMINGGGNLDIKAISDSALSTIDATGFNGTLTLGDKTALSQANLTISLDGGTANVFTSGAGDTITDKDGSVNLTASGANNVIKMTGAGADTIVAHGNGDQITLGTAGGTITANGTGDTFTVADAATGTVTIQGINGATATGIAVGSTVALSATGAAVETVDLQGAVTGGNSASYAATTLSVVNTGALVNDHLIFNNGGTGNTETLIGQVNVSSATTLAQALDLAANVASMSQQGANGAAGTLAAHNGVIDWFQFGGNTYIVEAVNPGSTGATNATLDANDVVVKIVGLVDLSHASLAAHTLSL